MTELLKQNIAKHISLSENETEQFCNLFQQKIIKKKSFLLREGEVCKFDKKTNKSFEARVAHIWKLTDGKIVSFDQFVDSKLVIDVMK